MQLSNSLHPPFFPEIPRYSSDGLIWQEQSLLCCRFPRLSKYGKLVHGIFTRKGGVSDVPFESLNVSDSVGDASGLVEENRRRVKASLGAASLIHVHQVHGGRVVALGEDGEGVRHAPVSGDAMITKLPGQGIMVKLADCQGVILYDPQRQVIAVAHSGWKGNVRNILGKTVRRMVKDFGCKSFDIVAAIGPSLGPCCGEFRGHEHIFPNTFRRFQIRENYFDLWAVSCWQLMEAGIRADHIEVSGICTRCSTDLFFSYRGEGRTGRFATAALLRS